MVSKPPQPSEKFSTREAKQQSKRGEKYESQNIPDLGPSTSAHSASAWTMDRTLNYSFQDEGEENLSMVNSPTGVHFSIYSQLTTPTLTAISTKQRGSREARHGCRDER